MPVRAMRAVKNNTNVMICLIINFDQIRNRRGLGFWGFGVLAHIAFIAYIAYSRVDIDGLI